MTKVAAVVAVILIASLAGSASVRASDHCSTSGSNTTCVYFPSGWMPCCLYPGSDINYFKVSGWNYWRTNRIWRPTGAMFSLYWANYNGTLLQYTANSSLNPFSIQGQYGYDKAVCENESLVPVPNVKCQVFNWYT